MTTPATPNPDPLPPSGDPGSLAGRAPDAPPGTHPASHDSSAPGPPQAAGAQSSAAPAGGRLGGYRLVRELGRGGMGVVYEAVDEALGRRVAVKVMAAALASEEASRRRFLREARAMAAVEHDHIVPVYAVGEDDSRPFIAMPLLAGQTLEARLAAGRLPVAEALVIARQVAEALAAAHAEGLVHRDVKPANIWLETNRSGTFKRVRLLDFGLTRAMTDDARITASNQLMGTPAYMAPEQAAGKPVDHRADLFSLGGVLYRMLTGRPPFSGRTAFEVLHTLATTTPLPPATFRPEVPALLSDLTMRLLAKVTANRPQSAEQLTAEFDRIALLVQTLDAYGRSPRNPPDAPKGHSVKEPVISRLPESLQTPKSEHRKDKYDLAAGQVTDRKKQPIPAIRPSPGPRSATQLGERSPPPAILQPNSPPSQRGELEVEELPSIGGEKPSGQTWLQACFRLLRTFATTDFDRLPARTWPQAFASTLLMIFGPLFILCFFGIISQVVYSIGARIGLRERDTPVIALVVGVGSLLFGIGYITWRRTPPR